MKKAFLIGLVLLPATASPARADLFLDFASFSTATSSLTTETFDIPPWVSVRHDQPVVSLGVSWTSPEILFGTTNAFLSSPRSISPLDGIELIIDELNAVMPPGITAVGGFVNNFGGFGPGVRLTAFNAGGGVLETIAVPLCAEASWNFLGVTTVEPIARAQFLSTAIGGPDSFALDNFVFGTAAVPEPSSLTLIFGLGSVVLLRFVRPRRRSHAQSSS
jgi:hypothetical protein